MQCRRDCEAVNQSILRVQYFEIAQAFELPTMQNLIRKIVRAITNFLSWLALYHVADSFHAPKVTKMDFLLFSTISSPKIHIIVSDLLPAHDTTLSLIYFCCNFSSKSLSTPRDFAAIDDLRCPEQEHSLTSEMTGSDSSSCPADTVPRCVSVGHTQWDVPDDRLKAPVMAF